MRRAKLFVSTIAGGLVGVAVASSALAQPVHDLVLRHATVVSPADGSLRRDVDVVVDRGRITAVSPAGRTPPAARRVVEARGEYVSPGFLDMHAHPLGSPDTRGSLELMLANGITGFRQMSGSPELLQARREGRLLPTADTPRVLAMPGTILTRVSEPTPEAAVAEIDRQKVEGADFIKLTDATPAMFFAAVAEAKRLGLTLVGHLPPTIDVRQASKAGMRSIEHLGPRDSVFLGCSTQEAALRASIPPPSPPHLPPGPPPPPAVFQRLLERMLADPVLATNPADYPRYDKVLDTFDAGRCDELMAEFKANGTWQAPTLIRLRTMEIADDPKYRNDPNLQYAEPTSRRVWLEVADQFARQMPPQKPSLDRLFKAQLELTRRIQRDGVGLMAGSDFGGGLLVSGFDLHEEFDLLAQAGLTPLQVLQAATVNGAIFLHMQDRIGAVAPGRDADLVILGADPTRSVAAMHRVDGVVRGGRYYARADLDAILRRTRDRYAAQAAHPGTAPPAKPGPA